MSINQYTKSERTDKKYPLWKSHESARYRLMSKSRNRTKVPICTNATSGRDLHELVTLEEINQIADRIVFDTMEYV